MIYTVRNLKYSYQSDAPVLGGINLDIKEGNLLTVLGRNGAGKSTLFSCLLGLRKGYEGEIKLCGREVKDLREKDIASIVGYVPQTNIPGFDFTVFEYVLTGCCKNLGLFAHPGKQEEMAAEAAMEKLGIEHLALRSITELSGGERQQAAIARAIASNPKLVIFDEPTAHLDFSHQLEVLKIIKALTEKGFSAVISTHDPNHSLVLGGDVALFDNSGKLSCGTSAEMLTEEKLNAVYGGNIKIRYMEEFKRNVCIYPKI